MKLKELIEKLQKLENVYSESDVKFEIKNVHITLTSVNCYAGVKYDETGKLCMDENESNIVVLS